ncbi:tagaturonate reductase [Paenibacillus cellulosilyticus]|uniref:Tagaturonate reductase n=1 Tax=Paenibacillus cellulosilyticus TaxID=375489 RepID=A0A2V2YYX9_9BACL|nr:tagaturonate reductase [Paenibacillus cellulosilyticus]PWW07142.1 tagaturonate reductase [Paenibacillus cellulosilyticus]QKS44650.1 tagaturonate reductase [Paenibacillus cellulosilyticus]
MRETLDRLSRLTADDASQQRLTAVKAEPVRVLQIGEGNFLRGFADWMIQQCRTQGLFQGGVAVTQPRPSGAKKLAELKEQDGLYTQLIRGLKNGEPVEETEVIAVFNAIIDPYAQWDRFMALADEPELQVVISNTTEAGLRYIEVPWTPQQPVESFPAKLTMLLYRRFETFGGEASRGLIMLPCELLERNGDTLLECVLKHAQDWGLSDSFQQWVTAHNRFLNSLVDRIVTGYPADDAEAIFEKLQYRDAMLNAAEPYHFWAIEAEPELERVLPFVQAGLNVVWTDDLKPYQLRKVRILNGAHTLMTPIGLLSGAEHVRGLMEHPSLGQWVRSTVASEIIPSVPIEKESLTAYANDVYDRYLNPFIRHRLLDIAMNSVSKFKARLLPTLIAYIDNNDALPEGLIRGLAALIRLYRVERQEDGSYTSTAFDGQSLTVRDDAAVLEAMAAAWNSGASSAAVEQALSRTDWWGQDIRTIAGMDVASAVTAILEQWEDEQR